jgi:hypothetical protein
MVIPVIQIIFSLLRGKSQIIIISTNLSLIIRASSGVQTTLNFIVENPQVGVCSHNGYIIDNQQLTLIK